MNDADHEDDPWLWADICCDSTIDPVDRRAKYLAHLRGDPDWLFATASHEEHRAATEEVEKWVDSRRGGKGRLPARDPVEASESSDQPDDAPKWLSEQVEQTPANEPDLEIEM